MYENTQCGICLFKVDKELVVNKAIKKNKRLRRVNHDLLY
jgi:hypothetical protein